MKKVLYYKESNQGKVIEETTKTYENHIEGWFEYAEFIKKFKSLSKKGGRFTQIGEEGSPNQCVLYNIGNISKFAFYGNEEAFVELFGNKEA